VDCPVIFPSACEWGYYETIHRLKLILVLWLPRLKKGNIPVGSKIIVLGGPAMLIGLGGGAASSINSGEFIVKASSANGTLKHNI
jgi:hypothetical protein